MDTADPWPQTQVAPSCRARCGGALAGAVLLGALPCSEVAELVGAQDHSSRLGVIGKTSVKSCPAGIIRRGLGAAMGHSYLLGQRLAAGWER